MAFTTLSSQSLPSQLWLQAEGWNCLPDLVHGFSGRLEGKPGESLPIHLHMAERLALHTLKQVHGNEILVIERRSFAQKEKEADGMITAEAGLLLGIATADCVPVLIVAPRQHLVAALHAGWRGTLQGISARAVSMLSADWHVTPEDLWVALGPSIGGCCYEVGADIGEAMAQRWGNNTLPAWRSFGEKGLLDLREVNRSQFTDAGVPQAQVQFVGPCTFCDSQRFASYRRERATAKRQLSVIGWDSPADPSAIR
jgi:YfiH family protein